MHNQLSRISTISEQPKNNFRQSVLSIPTNSSAELMQYAHSKADIIHMSQGDSCLDTPKFICEAAHNAMLAGKTHYPPVLGLPELHEELSLYYRRIFGCSINPNRFIITPSGTSSMHLSLTAILEPGDEVICLTPMWRNIMGIIHLAEAKDVQVSLDYNSNSGWQLDINKLFDACTSKTKAILITSPSNPTGWVMSRKEMEIIMNFARERGIWIISDSVYNRMVYNTESAPDFMQIANEDDKIISINSFSKAWSMTGWRMGWLIAPKSAIPVIKNITLYETMGVPTFNQYAGIEALRNGEEFIKFQMNKWQRNKEILVKKLSGNKNIEFSAPESSFYSFIKVRSYEDCHSLCRNLIDNAGVSVAPGGSFGNDFNSWIRLCFAIDEEKLELALSKIVSAL